MDKNEVVKNSLLFLFVKHGAQFCMERLFNQAKFKGAEIKILKFPGIRVIYTPLSFRKMPNNLPFLEERYFDQRSLWGSGGLMADTVFEERYRYGL